MHVGRRPCLRRVKDRPDRTPTTLLGDPRCGISSVLVICCFAGISEPLQSQRADGECKGLCVPRRSTAYCKKVLSLPRDRRRSRLKSHWTWISISCMTYCCKYVSYFWEGWADTRNAERELEAGRLPPGETFGRAWMTCIESHRTR